MLRGTLFLLLAMTASVRLAETAASLVSGEATAYENHKEVQRVTLTTDQLRELSRWLGQRQGNWGAHLTEPSGEPILVSLHVVRADGTTDYFAIVRAARGGRYMRLSVGPGIQWAYRSFGGILKTRYARQSINGSDFATLLGLLFPPNAP